VTELEACHCGLGARTPQHILIDCPIYENLRRTMWNGEHTPDTLKDLLTNHRHTRKTAQFLRRTGLVTYLGDAEPALAEPGTPASTDEAGDEARAT
jgi:hypothetical protein